MKISIKKGLDLRLEGSVTEDNASRFVSVDTDKIAIYPDDFEGFIPKCMVREGDDISIGQPLFYHKNDNRIKIVSPVNGTVERIVRGERRHIDSIIIKASESADNNQNDKTDAFNGSDANSLIEELAEFGLLVFIRRRPYADIPTIAAVPRDIFVTAFDSAPLAVNRNWSQTDLHAIQKGAEILSRITTGTVYLSQRPGSQLSNIKNVRIVDVSGPHPSGLTGIQAANIAPVNKGETIWTLSIETLWRIGKTALDRAFDPTTFVTVCGSCIKHPYIARTVIGAQIRTLTANNLNDTGRHMRFISGNVLTGTKVNPDDDFLHFPYIQLTVIPEGDDIDEFMGWASLSPNKMSISPSYPGRFFRRIFNPDARINGGRRAIIMSGEYDRVLPMDILSEYLIKAILARDIENMEKLGIYEIAPEDFALAECIDSSKLPLQAIIREGLDFLRKELS